MSIRVQSVHLYIKKKCQTDAKFNEQSEKDIFVEYKKFNIFKI